MFPKLLEILVSNAPGVLAIVTPLFHAVVFGRSARGCRRVRGLSPRSLYRALPFFERHGFKVIRRITAQGIWGIADGEEVSVTEKLI